MALLFDLDKLNSSNYICNEKGQKRRFNIFYQSRTTLFEINQTKKKAGNQRLNRWHKKVSIAFRQKSGHKKPQKHQMHQQLKNERGHPFNL